MTANVFHWGQDWRRFDPYFKSLDVGGYSYGIDFYQSDHERLPERIMLGSETHPRRVFDYWMQVIDHPYVIGDFSWTAIDYIGEAGLGWWSYGHSDSEIWPWNLTYSGDFDLIGNRRPRSYYREVLWSDQKLAYAFVHVPEPSFEGGAHSNWGWDDVNDSWNWKGHEGEPLKVDVYSNCEEVTLLLNGEDLGKQTVSRESRYIASWEVPYTPGELTVIGYRNEIEVTRSKLKTAGRAKSLSLITDRIILNADGQDLSYVAIEIVDSDGQRVPRTQLSIQVSIEGEGTLIGIGNGDPTSIESFQQPVHRTYDGRLLAIVRAGRNPGECKLTASCEGLESASITLQLVDPKPSAM